MNAREMTCRLGRAQEKERGEEPPPQICDSEEEEPNGQNKEAVSLRALPSHIPVLHRFL